jgi:hypothetical protein
MRDHFDKECLHPSSILLRILRPATPFDSAQVQQREDPDNQVFLFFGYGLYLIQAAYFGVA